MRTILTTAVALALVGCNKTYKRGPGDEYESPTTKTTAAVAPAAKYTYVLRVAEVSGKEKSDVVPARWAGRTVCQTPHWSEVEDTQGPFGVRWYRYALPGEKITTIPSAAPTTDPADVKESETLNGFMFLADVREYAPGKYRRVVIGLTPHSPATATDMFLWVNRIADKEHGAP